MGRRHHRGEQAVDVSSRFAAALTDRSAWAASLPTAVQSLVTLLLAGGQPPLQPLGIISVSQRVVPLGVAIDRFGRPPAALNAFAIDTSPWPARPPPSRRCRSSS